MSDLIRQIHIEVSLDFMALSSYGHGSQTSGQVRFIKDLDTSIEGLNVIVVEDILDTGSHSDTCCASCSNESPNASNCRVARQAGAPHQEGSEGGLHRVPDSQRIRRRVRPGLCRALPQSQGCLRSFASPVLERRQDSARRVDHHETTGHSRGFGARPAKRRSGRDAGHDHHSAGAGGGRAARDHVSN